MDDGACGCKGIRHCLLCENQLPDCPSDGKEFGHLKEVGSSKVYHYCMEQKCVISDGWIECECSEPYGFFNTTTTPKVTSRESGDEYISLAKEILLLENFVTEEESLTLVEDINKLPWKMSQSGRRKQVCLFVRNLEIAK